MTKISSPVAGAYINTPNQMEAVKVLSDVFKFQAAPKKNAKQKKPSENPVGTKKEGVFDQGDSKVQTRNGISKSTVKPVRINIPDTYRPYPVAPSRGPTMACDGSGFPPVPMPVIKLKDNGMSAVTMPTIKLGKDGGLPPVQMPTGCFEGGKLKPVYGPSDKPAIKTNSSGNGSIFGDTFKPGATPRTGNISPAKPTPENISPTKPKSGATPPAVSQNGQPPATISVAQLRGINKNVQISDTSPFVVTDNLKKMFEGAGFVKEDEATGALVTTKPISIGSGISLPVGTKITNSIDQRSTGRGGPVNDLGVPENIQLTTPNGSSIKFTAGIDKKSAQRTTVMEFQSGKSQDSKTITFLGAPIFDGKTGVLTTATNLPAFIKGVLIYSDLMARLNSAADVKREGWVQPTRAEIKKFFGNL